jgi:hypothetical protein
VCWSPNPGAKAKSATTPAPGEDAPHGVEERLSRASKVLSERSHEAADQFAVSGAELSVLEYLAAVSKRDAKVRVAEQKKSLGVRKLPRQKRKPKRKR